MNTERAPATAGPVTGVFAATGRRLRALPLLPGPDGG